MGKNLDNFVANLADIQKFLSDRQMMSELANRANVGNTSVYETFKAKSFDELRGKKLEVYKKAIELVDEIKSLPAKAAAIMEVK